MRIVKILALILCIASIAQGPSVAMQSKGGLVNRSLDGMSSDTRAQVQVTDPHKNHNYNAEQIMGSGVYEGVADNKDSFEFVRPHIPLCAVPDKNLITILTWLTSEQGVQLELATEKKSASCGNAAIMDQIHKVIAAYQGGSTK
jgi:hypothetical protein